jgi:peptide/nickel transport system permease protein
MTTYLIRRLLVSVPILLLISFLIFTVTEVAPGDPIYRITPSPSRLSEDQLKNLRRAYGLDAPVLERYVRWLTHAARGDFGLSFSTRRPVIQEVSERLPNTVVLVSVSFLVVLLVSIPLSLLSSARQYSAFDLIVTTVSFAGQAVPVYWLGMILILVFYGLLTKPLSSEPLLPIGGVCSWRSDCGMLDRLEHLILPVATLSLGWISVYTRFLRSSILDVVPLDFIRTAYAKGLPHYLVLVKHALRNSALPFITLIAMDLPSILGGALYVELVFSWPGVGRLYLDAAESRDYPVLVGISMLTAVAVVLSNVLADVAYAVLDPRVVYV